MVALETGSVRIRVPFASLHRVGSVYIMTFDLSALISKCAVSVRGKATEVGSARSL